MTNQEAIVRTDEQLLAELGYKQEFKRAFTRLEVIGSTPTLYCPPTEAHAQVFGIAFSIIGLVPSIA